MQLHQYEQGSEVGGSGLRRGGQGVFNVLLFIYKKYFYLKTSPINLLKKSSILFASTNNNQHFLIIKINIKIVGYSPS